MGGGYSNHGNHSNYVNMRNSQTTRFKRGIRITDKHYELIQENKKKKSAAGFLEEIIEEYFKPDLFKKKK